MNSTQARVVGRVEVAGRTKHGAAKMVFHALLDDLGTLEVLTRALSGAAKLVAAGDDDAAAAVAAFVAEAVAATLRTIAAYEPERTLVGGAVAVTIDVLGHASPHGALARARLSLLDMVWFGFVCGPRLCETYPLAEVLPNDRHLVGNLERLALRGDERDGGDGDVCAAAANLLLWTRTRTSR